MRACGLRERERGREERGGELCVCRPFVTSLEERLELGTIGRERERGDDVVDDDDDDVEVLAAWRVFASHPPTSTSVSVHSSRVSEQDF